MNLGQISQHLYISNIPEEFCRNKTCVIEFSYSCGVQFMGDEGECPILLLGNMLLRLLI